jgi:hypothetical protein
MGQEEANKTYNGFQDRRSAVRGDDMGESSHSKPFLAALGGRAR